MKKSWRASPPADLPQGITLGSKSKGKDTIALIDTDDVHCLMIGASGVGKTAYFL